MEQLLPRSVWLVQLDLSNLEAFARGCGVLGAGGGGGYRTGLLNVQQAVSDHGPVRVVRLDDLPDGLVMPCGAVGAPTVAVEKLGHGGEATRVRDRVEQLTGQQVVAVMGAEIGGANGCLPVAWAAKLGVPVLDGDGMGRAFPELQQSSLNLAGISPAPNILTDAHGNTVVIDPCDALWLERLVRATAVVFGGSCSGAGYLMTVDQARTAVIPGTVSLALQIGLSLSDTDDPVGSLLDSVNGVRLVEGKVIDVERRTTGGFARGSVSIEGLGADTGRLLRIEIQNENLVAFEDGSLAASVPDLITLVDTHTADPISTELLRYGQRVTAVAFPCSPIWRTETGLALVGPRAFGYDLDYAPVEDLHARQV